MKFATPGHLIPCFSKNKREWNESEDHGCDALTMKISTFENDSNDTFKNKMFGEFFEAITEY